MDDVFLTQIHKEAVDILMQIWLTLDSIDEKLHISPEESALIQILLKINSIERILGIDAASFEFIPEENVNILKTCHSFLTPPSSITSGLECSAGVFTSSMSSDRNITAVESKPTTVQSYIFHSGSAEVGLEVNVADTEVAEIADAEIAYVEIAYAEAAEKEEKDGFCG
jgi:hypothetical protein